MMQTSEKTYRIIPAKPGVFIFLWGFLIFFIIIFTVTFVNEGFEIASLAIAFIVLLIVGGVLGFFVYQARNAVFSITELGLKIGPGFYGRLIPWDKIDAAGIRVINLNLEKQYQAKWRLNGAGLPGYSAGWFKLYNKEKALLFVTDASNVVYIPTLDNYSVLLSPQDADEMAEALRRFGKDKGK
jgi:hypothetical protein